MQSLALFAAILILLVAAAEIIGRSPTLSRALPPPSIAASNPEFDIKLHQLELFAHQNGGVDCLLLGSSVVDDGLDPALVADIYTDQTGQEIQCFNFGLFTLTNDVGGPVAEALVRRFHPRVLIYEISARSFSDRFGELARPLIENPWVRYYSADQTFRGWLLDHSYAYRYYLAFKSWLLPANRPVIQDLREPFLAYGYYPEETSYTFDLAQTEVLFENYSLDRAQAIGFERVIALQQTHLVILEAPVHPPYWPNYFSGGIEDYDALFISPVETYLQAQGVPFWRSNPEFAASVPDDGWFDARHLNVRGAKLFSRWLGQQMVEKIPVSTFQ